MPRGDGTGPMGTGPGTGWGNGPCRAACSWLGYRRGAGYGAGRGMGWSAPDPNDQKALLEKQKELIDAQIRALDRNNS